MFQKFQFPCATQASWADRAGQVGDQPWGQGCQQTTRVSPTFFVGNSFKTPYFAIATRWRGRSKICGFTSFFSVCWTCGCACFFGVKFYVFACGLMLLSIWISSLLLRCGYCRSTCKGTAIHLVTTSESNVTSQWRFERFWRLRGPARKWITWRSNWRCSAERSFHWLLFWMHHVLTIPGWLFFCFRGIRFFFQTKYDVGVCIFSYATILNLKDFDTPIESWLMVYQMWGRGSWKRNLDPNWMVKSFFQWSRARLRVSMNWLNCYHQKW